MFILSLSYIKPLDEVDQHLEAHRTWLKGAYQAGLVLASGPKNPRSGGVILCRLADRELVSAFIKQDPFHQAGVASYEVIEFTATMAAEGLERLLD